MQDVRKVSRFMISDWRLYLCVKMKKLNYMKAFRLFSRYLDETYIFLLYLKLDQNLLKKVSSDYNYQHSKY